MRARVYTHTQRLYCLSLFELGFQRFSNEQLAHTLLMILLVPEKPALVLPFKRDPVKGHVKF